MIMRGTAPCGVLVGPAEGVKPQERRSTKHKAVGLLSTPRRAGEPTGFLGGPEQGLGLVDTFLLLEHWIRIGNNPGARLHVHDPVLNQSGSQDNTAVHLAIGGKIADAPG